MKNDLRKPCNDCPWRRASLPGWLGAGNPDYFLSAALADSFGGEHVIDSYAEPCHLTVDYSQPDWKDTPEEHQACVGSLIFYRNVDPFKLPRDPRRSALVVSVEPDHECVFSNADEFRDHHQTGVKR